MTFWIESMYCINSQFAIRIQFAPLKYPTDVKTSLKVAFLSIQQSSPMFM